MAALRARRHRAHRDPARTARGAFDVLVGVNLLREGLDLPEVSLVAILDADKEGFLRSEKSLIQTMGRAARNVNAEVILYADTVTESMSRAISETNRRREIQLAYNEEHGITPKTVKTAIKNAIEDEIEAHKMAQEAATGRDRRGRGLRHARIRPEALRGDARGREGARLRACSAASRPDREARGRDEEEVRRRCPAERARRQADSPFQLPKGRRRRGSGSGLDG